MGNLTGRGNRALAGRENELMRLWVDEFLSASQIAKEFECSPQTVCREITRLGLQRASSKKRCPGCRRVQNRDRFHRGQARCIECLKDGRFIRTYGIPFDEYHRLLAEQEGICAICGWQEEPLHVDHCHLTGKIRGLLCLNCNTGLGKFRDDPELLRRALAYL